jgi:hypothetical protein
VELAAQPEASAPPSAAPTHAVQQEQLEATDDCASAQQVEATFPQSPLGFSVAAANITFRQRAASLSPQPVSNECCPEVYIVSR